MVGASTSRGCGLPARSYAAADGKESRVFTWTGQTTLDLDTLGK